MVKGNLLIVLVVFFYNSYSQFSKDSVWIEKINEEQRTYSDIFNARNNLTLDSNLNGLKEFQLAVNFNHNPFFKLEEQFLEEENKCDTIIISIEYIKGFKKTVTATFNSGVLHRHVEYNELGKNGLDISYYKSGIKKDFRCYKDGIAISPSIGWYENGRLKYISEDIDSKYWYESGHIYCETMVIDPINDSFMESTYYENGLMMTEAEYNNGKKPYKSYYDNGNIFLEGYIHDMTLKKIDSWKEYYKNGLLKVEFSFHSTIPNLKIGTWKYYDEQGKLIKEEIYKAGELKKTSEYLPLNLGKKE